jgi:photosystem II stability/assembly factor-like uncharacterized protein
MQVVDTDFDPEIPRARIGRALGLIAVSVIAIAATGVTYVHPSLALFRGPGTAAPALSTDYHVTEIDFVSPQVGWVLVDLPSDAYAVIHTVDGGSTWTRQLTALSDGHPKYMKFFDSEVGVLALVGARPVLWRTADGGETWASRRVLDIPATVLSWSFVDSDHGWMLATPQAPSELLPARLYRTEDAGRSWVDLGPPVSGADQAFQVDFSYLTTGWLTAVGSAPYVYRTQDFGATWSKVALPPPAGGWPTEGQFFVAALPTSGQGVVVTVVYFAHFKGRSAVGGAVRSYPPLTVRSFDGGRLRTYLYTTVLDQAVTGPWASDSPPNQTELGSVDGGTTWSRVSVPSAAGAIGYFDATHWWWTGGGKWARSTDAGSSWSEPVEVGVVDAVPGSLRMLDRRHAWFAGAQGGGAVLESTSDGGAHWTLRLLPALDGRLSGLG